MHSLEHGCSQKHNEKLTCVSVSKAQRSCGVLYIAFGVPYLAMTLVSFASLRKTNPSVNVHIVTNMYFDFSKLSGWDPNKDSSLFLDMPTDINRQVKCGMDQYTPFQKTIFLDCDTVVLKDLAVAWALLDNFDIAAKQNAKPQQDPIKSAPIIFHGYKAGDVPHWNSGVILFRKNRKTQKFFERWLNAYNEGEIPFDQVALAKTILESGREKYLSLDERWNSSGPTLGRGKWFQTAIIFHYTTMMTPAVIMELRDIKRKFARCGLNSEDIEHAISRRRMSRRNSLGFLRYWLGELLFRFVGN